MENQTPDSINLKRKLDHILMLAGMLCDQYKHITCSERVSLLMALSMAVKQVSVIVGTTRSLLFSRLVDEYRVDYAEYARTFKALKERIKGILAGAPMNDCIDTLKRPFVGTEAILKNENSLYEFNHVQKFERINYIREVLIDNSAKLYEDVMDGIALIIADLEGIDEDYYFLKDNEDELNRIYEDLRNEFMQKNKDSVEDAFNDELAIYMFIHTNSLESYEKFQKKMENSADTISCDWIYGFNPAQSILSNRDRFCIDDLTAHFIFRYKYELFQSVILKTKEAISNGSYYESKPGDRINIVFGKYIENQYNLVRE